MTPPNTRYLALIREFPLRPICDAAGLDTSTLILHKLLDRQNLDQQETDYIDVLTIIIRTYETETNPLLNMEPVEVLRQLMKENGIIQSQLAKETKLAATTISNILNKQRPISANIRQILAKRFNVSPMLFV